MDPASSSGTRTKSRASTVLVVDDLEDNRELFAAVLRDAGFIVSLACDGAEALEIAARERPRVILMDVAMPGLDGFETIERLRLEEHGRAARIIVVSAFDDRVTRSRARDLGVEGFLGKPCAPSDLVARVKEAHAELDLRRAVAG